MSAADAAGSSASKAKSQNKSHPKYDDMIITAIKSLKERNGSSRQAITKHLKDNFELSGTFEAYIKVALRRMTKKEILNQVKGTGASGSFKLNKTVVKKEKVAAKKPAKKPAAAKPKKKKEAAKKKVDAKKKKSKTKKPTDKKKVQKKTVKKSTKKSPSKPKSSKKSPAKKSPAKKAAKKSSKAKSAGSKKKK